MTIPPPKQLPLDLSPKPQRAAASFVRASANDEALRWIELWPQWPGGILVLIGEASSGKSHLGQIWAEKSGATPLGFGDLANIDPMAAPLPALLDVQNPAALDQTALFHLINATRERNSQMLILSRLKLRDWPVELPDLASRLSQMPVAEILPPDDFLRAEILIKLLTDRQLPPISEIVQYILARAERSYLAIDQLVAAIDQKTLAEKRPLTLPLVRQVLETMNR